MNFGNASLSWSPATSEEVCQLFNQIEVHPDPAEILDTDDQSFAAEGDSGSLVFLATKDNQNIWAIGMVVGGIIPNGSALVTPIWTILDRFGLPRCLLSFESQRLRKIELYMKDTTNALENLISSIEHQTNMTDQRLTSIEKQTMEILNRLPASQ